MNKIIVHGSFESEELPKYSSTQASGADIRAYIKKEIEIPPGEHSLIPTGVYLQIPEGYEAQVRPRSGLAAKHGVTVLNSPGTIDADYRGEVKVVLINHGRESFVVKNGDRIAQLVFAPVIRAEFFPNAQLSETERGEGGFGSTGH